jgi:osmotically inducible protein OsmC
MAFANTLDRNGRRPESIQTHATCIPARQEDGGFPITRMNLSVRGWVPGINAVTFAQIAEEADKGCPVSNFLRSGLKIVRETALLQAHGR